jgi:type I restriction enzyme S subunit
MSFPRYPKYKDSGFESLGDVPEHWGINRLSNICQFQSGKAHEPYIDDDGEFICVNSRFVSTEGLSRKFCTQNLTPAKLNDILMVMSDLPNGRALAKAFFVSDHSEYAVNQRVCILTPCKNNPRFLFYLLNRNPLFLLHDDGVNQTHLSNATFTKFPTLTPPVVEQSIIAAFLDSETGKIDELVAEQQRLIELLKEKRQAVISHAVTKGLNPDAPMKPSGIEWLGDVPEHWNTRTIAKASTKITNGYVGPTRDILVERGTPYIQATHIKKGRVNFDESYFVAAEWSRSHSKSILAEGDVLIVQTGAGTGDVALVARSEVGFNCHALIIVTSQTSLLSGSFLAAVLQSEYGRQKLESIQTGGMHPHLNCGNVKYVEIPLPPKNEQAVIVSHIYEMSSRFDSLTIEAQHAIDLLQERRSALISAAVTGKIDVRVLVGDETL